MTGGNCAGRGVVSIDERRRDVQGQHSRVCGAGLAALPWKQPGTTDGLLAPMELSLHVPLLWQEEECFRHP